MEATASGPAQTLLEIRSSFDREGALRRMLPVQDLIDGLADAIAPFTTPDFACTMDGGALTTRYEGVEGLRTGWHDFLAALETLRIVPGEIRDSADGTAAVEFVRLVAPPG